MLIPDLIARLEARPFRPFTLFGAAGRQVKVTLPHQCALSPDHALIVVALGAQGLDVMSIPELTAIADMPGDGAPLAAERAASEHVAAPGAPPPSRPHEVTLKGGNGAVVTWPDCVDGLPIVTAVARAADGRTILDLSGTQFDVHATEAGDNYLTVEMTHAAEPGKVTRVLVWPPATGSLQTFAEAMPLDQVLGVLRAADEQLRRRPRFPAPGNSYFELLVERDERPHVNEDSPEAGAPDRFVVHTSTVEAVPGRWVTESRLFDRLAGVPVLDLYGTALESHITPPGQAGAPGAPWSAALALPNGGARVEFTFDPRTRRACLGPRAPEAPVAWIERIARLHDVFDAPATFERVLLAGPRPFTEPLARLVRADDVIVELWPAPARVRWAMLKPRILGAGDRPLLDLRPTEWGAKVTLADPFVLRHRRAHADPHTVTLQLIAESGTAPHELACTLLAVSARTRRVTSPDTPGVTTLGVLQRLLQEFGSPSVLRENLHEAMDAGDAIARL